MKARIVMMVHDSIWVEALQEEQDEVRGLEKRTMTAPGNPDVPLL